MRCCLIGLLLLLAACRPNAPVSDETIVATVNGGVVRAGQVRVLLTDELQLRGTDARRSVAEKRHAYEAQILDQLIDTVMLEQRAGPTTASNIAQQAETLLRREQARFRDATAYERQLARQGQTARTLRQRVYRGMLLEAVTGQSGEPAERLCQRLRSETTVVVSMGETTLSPPLGQPASGTELLWAGLLVSVLAGLGWWGLRRLGAGWLVLAAFAVGVALRFGIWASTPYDVRAHDVEEHLAYVSHVAQHGTIPDSQQGFMFYQPPLYYFIGAAIGGVRSLQTLGLGLSVVTLAIGLGLLVFTRRGWAVGIGAFLLAATPSLVFLAARVNNDALANCINFFAFALLVVWWQRGECRWWLAALVAIGVGLLTKSTALLLLAVAVGAALLRPKTSWKLKAQWIGAGLLIVGLLAGWLWVRRLQEGQRQLVANLGTSSAAMKLTDNRADFVTFNPVRVVAEPYNHGWFRTPDRDHFWEYWFRSSLFGQFTFPEVPHWLARALVVAGCATAGAFLFGLARGARGWTETLPFLLLLVVSLGGHIAYVVSAPFAASHDFRYSLLLLLPVTYLLAQSPKLALVAVPLVLLAVGFLTLVILH